MTDKTDKTIIDYSNPDMSTLNVFGVRPHRGFSFDNTICPDVKLITLPIITTYEGIKQVILNPLLEVDRESPPIAFITVGVNANIRGFDARIDARPGPYTLFLFQAPCSYKGVRGMTSWEYVDSLNHDKTVGCDLMLYWAPYCGMLKKLADIGFVQHADETVITLDREGKRLGTMRVRIKEELKFGANPLGSFTMPTKWLFVREIPNLEFTGYVDRCVISLDMPPSCFSPKKMWAAEGSVEFSDHCELDPLDLLTVVETRPGFASVIDSPYFGGSRYSMVDQLPLQP